MPSEPKEPNRQAVLKNFKRDDPRCDQIEKWLSEQGAEECLRRMEAELGVKVAQSTLYEGVKYWRQRNKFNGFLQRALDQARMEAEQKGGMTAEEMEDAVDRYFVALASENDDPDVYRELRYLRIRDRESKANQRLEEAKLEQKNRMLAQKDRDLQLVERRVVMLEKKINDATATVNDSKLTPEEQAERIRQIFKR